MNDQAHASQESIASRIARWCSTTWKTMEESTMMDRLDTRTIEMLAHDNGLSTDDLISLVERGPRSADEMNALMQVLGIDAYEASLSEPLDFREMQITCSRCGEKSRCRRELAEGTAPATFPAYCGNADQMNELRARPDCLLD